LTGAELQTALQDDVGHHLMRGLPRPFPVDPQVLVAYAGKYQSTEGVIVTIRVDTVTKHGSGMKISDPRRNRWKTQLMSATYKSVTVRPLQWMD
jgi:hypothetical protein